MKIEMVRGCINNYLGIDDIREIDMTEEQKERYFDEIIKILPKLHCSWFNRFLQWVCEEYGYYECSEKPCEQCGDYTETFKLEI